MYFCFFCLCVFLITLLPLFFEYYNLKLISLLSHLSPSSFFSPLLSLSTMSTDPTSLILSLSLKFLKFFYISWSLLSFSLQNFQVPFFSIAVTPSHHLTVTSSRRHTTTSAQARCHNIITSPLLRLTVTPSPHVCNSSPLFQSGEEWYRILYRKKKKKMREKK